MGLFEQTGTLRELSLLVYLRPPVSHTLELGWWQDWSFLGAIPKGLHRLRIDMVVRSTTTSTCPVLATGFGDLGGALREEIIRAVEHKFSASNLK